jgi:glycine betaine/proline transport system permease protein
LGYYANAGKSAFKGRIEKGGIGTFAVDFAMGYWDEATNNHLGYCFNPDCVDFWCSVGIVAARSKTADVIIRPILDLMQTMPAFVYLIPAIFFLV